MSVAFASHSLKRVSSLIPWLVALLIIFGLVLAVFYVVSDGKQQAEMRNRATALRAKAEWHCNSVRAVAARDRCLLQMLPPHNGGTRL
jgi:hypothetical protein